MSRGQGERGRGKGVEKKAARTRGDREGILPGEKERPRISGGGRD